MGTGSGSPVGGGGTSYFKKSSAKACSLLNITESLKSMSPRGKMIPEELEKQIWQARKKVRRGERKKKERKGMHGSGCEGEIAREGVRTVRPISVCGTEKRAR